MAGYQVIKRLETLIHLLQNYSCLSKEELKQRLEEDYDIQVSNRTLERDLSALMSDFGIEPEYRQDKHGYQLKDTDDKQVSNFLQFAGRIYLGELLQEGLRKFQDLKDMVKLEDYSSFEGIKWLHPLLLAIQNHYEVNFIHENFEKNKTTPYTLTPFHLREYQGRWYVVGLPKGENHIKTFGLSRISGLKSGGTVKAKAGDYKSQLKKFEGIIGLNYNAAEEKELIELAVTKNQYKYMKTLPLHSSQGKEEMLADGRIKISLLLIPNYELKMELLKLGDQIEVLSPKSLRNDIKATLSNTLKQYKNG